MHDKHSWLLNLIYLCFFLPLAQVMKRGRTEQIQHAVAQYLKRRQYADMDSSLKGAKLSQSAEEMAANLMGTVVV